MSSQTDEIDELLKGLLDADGGFSLDDLCEDGVGTDTTCRQLLGEVVSEDAEEEFTWGPSVLTPPVWDSLEGDVGLPNAQSSEWSPFPANEDAQPTSEKSCSSVEVPVLDSASSSGEVGSNSFLIPAKKFVFPFHQNPIGFGCFGQKEIITTGVPGIPHGQSSQMCSNTAFPSLSTGGFVPSLCPNVEVGQSSGTSSTKPDSSGDKGKKGKRCRVDDGAWKLIKDPEERKKQKRMAKNRHTAAVSRARRRQYLQDLEHRVKSLEEENMSLKYWLSAAQHENMSLKAGANMKAVNDSSLNPAMVMRTSGESQEPAALNTSTLLAILQLVASPMILPMLGLLLVLMGTVNSMEGEEPKFCHTSHSLIAIMLAILSVLLLPSPPGSHKDKKENWKGRAGALEALPSLSRIRQRDKDTWTELSEVQTECSGNLDKLGHSHCT